ncbi:MAG TPA: hypothetical protein VKX25_17770 [Bryobacteraceae bacterium]|nr:hypothetical protein [Bryobacteraceae bacterium]
MTFTLAQALKAQQALRNAAGLPPEEFPENALIGMLSDEIEVLRNAGKTDEEIASLINKATGGDISSSSVQENYATPDERQHGRAAGEDPG